MVRHHSASTYGVKSLAALGPKIWKKASYKYKAISKTCVFIFHHSIQHDEASGYSFYKVINIHDKI